VVRWPAIALLKRDWNPVCCRLWQLEFRYDKAAAGRCTPKSDLGVDSDLHPLKYLKVFFGEFESRAVAFGFVVTGMGA
jgi:hypothetical protein